MDKKIYYGYIDILLKANTLKALIHYQYVYISPFGRSCHVQKF